MTAQSESLFSPSYDPAIIPWLEAELADPKNHKHKDVINKWLTDIRIGETEANKDNSLQKVVRKQSREIVRQRNRADSNREIARTLRLEIEQLHKHHICATCPGRT
ncbi:hypothetical protein LCGC14_0430050 [marine sediment metagenome]|uniref:Uncharacterized protein n=1 Tax=marine sediment metagenome TaxID=412755 RepID=A0A0F9SUK9_9ZZZZ